MHLSALHEGIRVGVSWFRCGWDDVGGLSVGLRVGVTKGPLEQAMVGWMANARGRTFVCHWSYE